MPKYRKKSVDVEMLQWTGDLGEVERWVDTLIHEMSPNATGDFQLGSGTTDLRFWCDASKATVSIAVGDWIALERDGDGFYPLRAADQLDAYEQEPIVDVE